MRTTYATRDGGLPGSGVSRSESDLAAQHRGAQQSVRDDNCPHLPHIQCRQSQRSLAGATQQELILRARHGDRRALDKLIDGCKLDILAEVGQQHRWLRKAGFDCWKDLYQEAHLGVLDALENYDASRAGQEFRGYANYYIRKYVRICAVKQARSESISSSLVQKMASQAKREQRMNLRGGSGRYSALESGTASLGSITAANSGSGPRSANLAAKAAVEDRGGIASGYDDPVGEGNRSSEDSERWDTDQQRWLRECRLRPRPYSLETTNLHESEHDHFSNPTTLKDLVVDETEPVPGEDERSQAATHRAEDIPAEAVHAAVANLDKQERIAVAGRYGLGTEGELSIKELAGRLAISESALKELLCRARAKLSMALAVEMVTGNFSVGLSEQSGECELARSA